jgi:two-component system, OmpR family, response regulator RstA
VARILFCDDDREQLRIFQLLLEPQGHEMVLADGPSAAFDGLAAPIDLVILDLRFPTAADGLTLIRRIRASGYGTPILLLSGCLDDIEGTPEESLVSRLMLKPAPMPDLLRAIGELTA